MKNIILATIVAMTLTAGSIYAKDIAVIKPVRTQDVDLVICLDTSNSMDGLIDSAKQKLWAIVNELATAKPKPNLRVGLYQYGNDNLNKETGWVQQVCPLSSDLDGIYEKLFALKTRGGTEYVARVVRASVADEKWSASKNALKMIVVAGNEAATQDKKYQLKETCSDTISKGIIINTIFCGPEATGRKTGWANAADWTDGQYSAIDQNKGTVAIETPFDDEIIKLSGELNKTYVGFGRAGKAKFARQAKQDSNAASMNKEASVQRAGAKASGLYRNASWDLVDAAKGKDFKIEDVKDEELPEEMKKMSVEERKAHVKKLTAQRAEIQKKIAGLSKKRDAFRKKKLETEGLDESKSFDASLRRVIRQQGAKKGMVFESK